MGTVVERVRREMDVLAADCGYTPDGDGDLLRSLTDYKGVLEELVVELAEKLEQRGSGPAPAAATRTSSSGPADQLELRRGTQRHRIVHHLAGLTDLLAPEGRTADEISGETGMPLNSISTRMSELVAGGWVVVRAERGGKSAYVATSRAVSFFQREPPLAV